MTVPRLPLTGRSPVVGIDLGGTAIKSCYVDADGVIVGAWSEPTRPSDVDGLADQLAAVLARAEQEGPGPAAAAGLLVPGLVDDSTGRVLQAANLGLRDAPLGERLRARLPTPLAFANDARGAGVAEVAVGAAVGYHDVVIVSIGTGIGAAVLIEGRTYDAAGYGCELGHLPTALAPPGTDAVCGCGGTSCLELVASAAAIRRGYAHASGTDPGGAKEVFAQAAAGDTTAAAVLRRATDALALAFAQVATIIGPQAILVAGGLSQAGEALLAPIRERMAATLTVQRVPTLVTARFGDEAGMVSGALIADRMVAASDLVTAS